MALPRYNYPNYTLVVPSTGKELKYRPFLVKDEKSLLLSQQSEEKASMYSTLKTVISSCILDNTKVDDLAVFDLEYIFTQLRCRSIGEETELIFTCQNETCKKKEPYRFTINPSVIKNENHTNNIKLFDGVGIVMKYPSTDVLSKLKQEDLLNPDKIIDLIVSCIDYIYNDDEVFHAKEQSKKELTKFIEELPRSAADKLKVFFETSPRLEQKVKYKCNHCGTETEYVIEGIDSFF